MRDTIRLFDLRLDGSPKKRPDPFGFSRAKVIARLQKMCRKAVPK